MASSKQAQHSLIDPLVEPDPSDDTGLNSHFRSTFAPRSDYSSSSLKDNTSVKITPQTTGSTTRSTNTNPFRRSTESSVKSGSVISQGEITPQKRSNAYPSPPNSASPARDRFFPASHRAETFGSMNGVRPRRASHSSSNSANPFADAPRSNGISRSGSLRERYPGDNSHRPLDIIRKDTKAANRAYHLRKKNLHGTDTIDRLDTAATYHHDGPYDAANIARNTNVKYSPIAAVKDSNEEALRATPRENVLDAITRHRPLEGVAIVPPGVPDAFGRVYDYKEGADLQREAGGDYRRWPGVEYKPGDLKGKGEPTFTIEEGLKAGKEKKGVGMEMKTRRRNQSLGATQAPRNIPSESMDGGSGLARSNTTGRNLGNTLKKRFGSIRRKKVEA
ncbi:hypothetical protein GQ43DRAFT_439340 [Delitschia confertaspora ATCC 74209]|uniref:Pal1 cell morphology protein n=1 Tax=Delitschia confertaspora ATCC 74209 TaxID=1513339 RepID=A0A9P4JNP4_9PLEO|nr:hypothetical protein GQ43DRAFT_439340 [Delitschia confertaspora ATCC 74209]